MYCIAAAYEKLDKIAHAKAVCQKVFDGLGPEEHTALKGLVEEKLNNY